MRFIDKQDELLRHLIIALRLPIFQSELVQQNAIISEFLRDCIQKLTNNEFSDNPGSEIKAVHIRKIMYVLRQQLDAVWPVNASIKDNLLTDDHPLGTENIKRMLDNLQQLGDILHVGNGYWVPTPIRLIQLPNKEDIAFIGGCSTTNAFNITGSILQEGLGRVIKKGTILKSAIEDKALWQPYSQWVGWVPKDLSDWTKSQLENAIKEGANSMSSYEDYEVFTSFTSNRNFRSPWIRVVEVCGDLPNKAVLLCRTRDKRVLYFLGVFQNGQIIKELPIKDKEILSWLRLGLRNLHGRKLTGRWTDGKLKIYPQLPLSLERIILLYSYKIKSSEETAYYVLDENRKIVEENLKNYGYVFIKR